MFIEYNGRSPQVDPTAFVAPTAVLIGDVLVGAQSSIWFGAVVRADNGPIRIGARTNVQDNAVIHVSPRGTTSIGDDVTIGHGATMEDCTIGNGSLVGSNAVVLNGAVVGDRTLVAAGSVVAAGAVIPENVLAAGAPATVKKPIDGASATWLEAGSASYVSLSRVYLHHGYGDPEIHELVAEHVVS